MKKRYVFNSLLALFSGLALVGLACKTNEKEDMNFKVKKVEATEVSKLKTNEHDSNAQFQEAPPFEDERDGLSDFDGGMAQGADPSDLRCSRDFDCVPIPVEGCVGCMKGEAQMAVNIEAAKRIMGAKKERCMKILKDMGRPPQNQQDGHQTCDFNGANCVEGRCKLAKLSEEELKKRMEMIKQQSGNDQGNGQRQGGFDRQRQGGFDRQQPGGFGSQRRGGFRRQQPGGFGGQQPGGFGGGYRNSYGGGY